MCELKQGMIKSYKGPGIDEYGTLWQVRFILGNVLDKGADL